MIKEYPETHQQGLITIEQNLKTGSLEGDLGIQIAKDGRIWICINGISAIRFKPLNIAYIEDNSQMILNKTTKHRNRYRIIPGSQGNYGNPDYYPTHKFIIVNGIDKGNGYQGYYSITYFLTEMGYVPIEAKNNLKKFLKKRGYSRYLNKITLNGFKSKKED